MGSIGFIARRHLTAQRRQAFTGLVTAIAVLGITVGVLALTVALALETGLQKDVQAKILGTTAHITILHISGTVPQYREAIRKVSRIDGVEAVAPIIFNYGMVASRLASRGAVIKGVEPREEQRVTGWLDRLDPAARARVLAWDTTPAAVPGLVLGATLARRLGVMVGDSVRLLVAQGRLSPLGILPTVRRFQVVGLLRGELTEVDEEWCFTSLHQAQRLFGLGDNVEFLTLRIRDLERTEALDQQVVRALGNGFTAHDWKQANRALLSAFRLEKLLLFLVIGLITVVAALNISTTLVMLVAEKHRDIGVLMALGLTRKAIQKLFVLQGLWIGLIGTAAGALLGVGLCLLLDRYQLVQVDPSVYMVSYVPFKVELFDMAVVCATALAISLLATIYPAYRASRLQPAEALRYE
jgi:lipoprotein-releasing system permease protein